MPTTITITDEPTRKAVLGALWEYIGEADHKIDGFSDGMYELLSGGFRPEATATEYEAMRTRFDGLMALLTEAREDVARVEVAELRTAVVLKAITKEKLVEELDSYRRWIRDDDEEFWNLGRERQQDVIDQHDAITALLAEFDEPAAVA